VIERWLEGWTRGWCEHDVEAIAALYAEDAVFVSEPFREPERPADYAARVFAEEESAEFRFGKPVIDGDRAAIEYWAVIDGVETLFGVAMIRFGEDGRVVEQRDYWSMQSGRREPRPEWGYTVP
jgi:SnoaL-like domain